MVAMEKSNVMEPRLPTLEELEALELGPVPHVHLRQLVGPDDECPPSGDAGITIGRFKNPGLAIDDGYPSAPLPIDLVVRAD